MNVRLMLRTAAAAVAIGVIAMGSPAGHALAAPNETPAESCKRRGYGWDDRLGCADKKCEHNGRTYGALDVIKIKVRTPSGFKDGLAYCNGFTGEWVVMGPSVLDPSRADPSQPLPSFQPVP